jgi:hypothetical protein
MFNKPGLTTPPWEFPFSVPRQPPALDDTEHELDQLNAAAGPSDDANPGLTSTASS